ncbi:hypothetical protein [Halobacillus sp. A5]|uniref:hypothetical protein n=1 Tax=Halobacillus sp. A5 TaxID=2880263 RepID=UPI0020A6553C|nr:hypothetical protein [Halobacillus sp. A5]MCP3028525.1 hypothetical protein [Halobacillus sp. A5]
MGGITLWLLEHSKTWPIQYLDYRPPLNEEQAVQTATKSAEGYLPQYLPGNNAAPWDVTQGIRSADGEIVEEIEIVIDQGDSYQVEFRHQGDFCRQLFIEVDKTSGHILNKARGTSQQ